MAQCYGRILYNNALIAATASYTGTPVDGFPQELATDWLDWTGFRVVVPASSSVVATWTFPSGASIDGLAFLLRPVTSPATLTIAASKGGTPITSWAYSAADPLTLCRFSKLAAPVVFSAAQALDITFTNASGSSITVDLREIAAGTVLTLFTGQRVGLPRMANRFGQVFGSAMAVNGSILSRELIRREKTATIKQDYATESWIATYWAPFVAHAERFGFFWSWHLGAEVLGVAPGLDPCLAAATEIGPVDSMSPAPCLTTGMQIACVDGFTPGGVA